MIPSIRRVDPDYLAGVPEEVRVIVVDDSNGRVGATRPNMTVSRDADCRRVLGNRHTLIPRRSDTCRNFGFYMAWREGYRYIATLDDDCRTAPGFLDDHAVIARPASTLCAIESPPWYNTLESLCLHDQSGNVTCGHYARGYPYAHRIEPPETTRNVQLAGEVVCNMGLWTAVPDINGIDKLGRDVPRSVALHHDRVAIAPETQLSLCIMNVAFRATIVPAFYQLPMDLRVGSLRIDRFGDIWAGYIFKRLADRRGELITIGRPLVEHTKAGNVHREVHVEHFGHLLSPYFYELVDRAAADGAVASYATMYADLADRFLTAVGNHRSLPTPYRKYLDAMGRRMLGWAELFEASRQTPDADGDRPPAPRLRTIGSAAETPGESFGRSST